MSEKTQEESGAQKVNLSDVTEATRRALYNAVAAVHFNPSPDEIREARRQDEWYQHHGPDESRLTVLHFAGRWFACWRIPDADEGAPEEQAWSLVRVVPNLARPYGIEFYEV